MNTATLNTTNTFCEKITPWVVCFSAALFFFYVFIQINMLNVLAPELYKSFHIRSADQMASLSAYYFYGNVLMLFPAGILLDHFSPRKIITIGMITLIAFTFIFAISHSLALDELCRFIIGLAGAFCLLSPIRIASRWFPPTKMALVIGSIITFAWMGGMVAQAPFSFFMKAFGWRHTIMGDVVLGILLLILIILFVKDAPKNSKQSGDQDPHLTSNLSFWQKIGQALKNSQNWLAGLYASSINLPIFLLGGLWSVMYLEQSYNFNPQTAAFVPMFIFIGTMIGSPLFGWFSDKIVNRKLPMIIGAILSLITILIIMYMPHLSYTALIALFFIYGFVTSSQVIAYPVVVESNPLFLTGTAEGIASVIIMSGGFAHILFSKLLNWHWSHQIVNNVPVYTNINYQHAFWIMPIGCIISLFIAFCIKETHCKNYVEK